MKEGKRVWTSTRGVVLFVLSLIAPGGLLLVNIAYFVTQHIFVFRLATTVAAVVSSLVLNSLAAITGYRYGVERRPDAVLFSPRNRGRVQLFGAIILMTVAALFGFFTYRGLSESQLPNGLSMLGGVIGLAFPVAGALLLRQTVNPRARRRFRTR